MQLISYLSGTLKADENPVVKIRSGIVLLVTCFLVLIFSSKAEAQERVDITASMGVPEWLNCGIRINFSQFQIGLNSSVIPFSSQSANIYYHFAGRSELTEIRPWYGMAGLNYLHNDTTFLFLNFRLGREFNITPGLALQLDAGILYHLNHISSENYMNNLFGLTDRILASFSWSFIWRINPPGKGQ